MRKIFAAILIAAAALSVGCGHDIKPSGNNSNSDTTSEMIGTTSAEKQDIVCEMLDNIVLYGEKLPLSSSFDDLDDNYTAADPIPYEGRDISTYTLYYKDKNIGFIDLSKDNELCGLFIDDDVPDSDFSICGIGYGSCKDDIIQAFGEPNVQTEGSFIYGESEDKQVVFGFNGDKIRSVKIFC